MPSTKQKRSSLLALSRWGSASFQKAQISELVTKVIGKFEISVLSKVQLAMILSTPLKNLSYNLTQTSEQAAGTAAWCHFELQYSHQ